jgi:hypothetical protein
MGQFYSISRFHAVLRTDGMQIIWVRFISVETRKGGRVAAVFAAYRDPKAVVSTLAPGASAGVRRLENVAYSTTCSNSNEMHPFDFWALPFLTGKSLTTKGTTPA